jgi:hypothetical protein
MPPPPAGRCHASRANPDAPSNLLRRSQIPCCKSCRYCLTAAMPCSSDFRTGECWLLFMVDSKPLHNYTWARRRHCGMLRCSCIECGLTMANARTETRRSARTTQATVVAGITRSMASPSALPWHHHLRTIASLSKSFMLLGLSLPPHGSGIITSTALLMCGSSAVN